VSHTMYTAAYLYIYTHSVWGRGGGRQGWPKPCERTACCRYHHRLPSSAFGRWLLDRTMLLQCNIALQNRARCKS